MLLLARRKDISEAGGIPGLVELALLSDACAGSSSKQIGKQRHELRRERRRGGMPGLLALALLVKMCAGGKRTNMGVQAPMDNLGRIACSACRVIVCVLWSEGVIVCVLWSETVLKM